MQAGDPISELRRQPDEVDLFCVSAAMWVPHRIHYDRDYCRTEGHEDLLVHGPLQGVWLGQMVSRWITPMGGRLVRLRYRNRRPVYVGQAVACRGTVTEVSVDREERHAVCDVWVERSSDGERTTVGTAEVLIPGVS